MILPKSSVEVMRWIAHAFTKQLAFQRLQSVIPVVKKEDDLIAPSPLLRALLDTLAPFIHSDITSFGCYLMLVIVSVSLNATESIDLKQILEDRGISLQSCHQYLDEEMKELMGPMETRERDLRAWQWSICSCLGVCCEIECSSFINVLDNVFFFFISSPSSW